MWVFFCDTKNDLPEAEQFFSSGWLQGSVFVFFRNIYLDSIWTGQTRASVFLRLQRDSTVDHPSLLSGHVSVKSCQKVLHRTRPLCSECIVDVFAVCCGCFVLVSAVNTCWIQIHRGGKLHTRVPPDRHRSSAV